MLKQSRSLACPHVTCVLCVHVHTNGCHTRLPACSLTLEHLWLQRIPERIIEKAVKGMLTRGRLGNALFRHLKVRFPAHSVTLSVWHARVAWVVHKFIWSAAYCYLSPILDSVRSFVSWHLVVSEDMMRGVGDCRCTRGLATHTRRSSVLTLLTRSPRSPASRCVECVVKFCFRQSCNGSHQVAS